MPYVDKERGRAYFRFYQRNRYRQDPEYRERVLRRARKYHHDHPEHHQEYRKALRLKVLEFLGGKCVYCGCDNLTALEINHKNGGGCQENRILRGHSFHLKILNGERTIEDLELTCRVCNANHFLKRKGITGITVIWNPPNQGS